MKKLLTIILDKRGNLKIERIIAGTSADASADIPADIPTKNSQHAIYPISRYFFYVVKLPAHPMP